MWANHPLLDESGIRGVSELIILHDVMARIQKRQNLPELPRPYKVKPLPGCHKLISKIILRTHYSLLQYFDLIGGTSTGGCVNNHVFRWKIAEDVLLD
jgi:hypothetical protein